MFLKILITITYPCASDITVRDVQSFISRRSEIVHFFFSGDVLIIKIRSLAVTFSNL